MGGACILKSKTEPSSAADHLSGTCEKALGSMKKEKKNINKNYIKHPRKRRENGKNEEKFLERDWLEVRWPWPLSSALKCSNENCSFPHGTTGRGNL